MEKGPNNEINIFENEKNKNNEEKRDQEEVTVDESLIRKRLQERFDSDESAIKEITLLKAKDLPEKYRLQRDIFNDERLDNITIALISDNLWMKSQPSESDAEMQLIIFKQSYFETEENPDEIAWLCHELAHCQKFLDSESIQDYYLDMKKVAFSDIETEHSYPNNLVERFAFTKQFQYLKGEGKDREDILSMLNDYYGDEDTSFFNKLLDYIYEK